MMIRITFIYAVALLLLGAGAYLLTQTSLTAFIPSFFSIPFFLIGWVATFGENWRKHAMHFAAALALIIILMLSGMLVNRGIALNVAGISQLVMLLLTMGYLAFSINSFITARRNRAKG